MGRGTTKGGGGVTVVRSEDRARDTLRSARLPLHHPAGGPPPPELSLAGRQKGYRPWLRQRLTTRATIASSSPLWRQSSEKHGSDEAGRRPISRSSNETRIGIDTPSP